MLGLPAAQHLADPVIDRRVGGMVLAVHLEIDVQRRPTGAEIGLPLQLHIAARDRQRGIGAVLVVEGDGAVLGVHLLQRHIEHPAGGGRDRQEDRIGLLALLTQGGHHDLHQRVVALAGAQERRVELARPVEVGGRDELVFEAERVEEAAQHRVVVVAEALELAERVGDRGQRALQVLAQHGAVGHVVGHLAHPVHIVREADEAGRDVRDRLEGAPDHRRPRHPRRRCRCGAGPRGRSRSRTGHSPCRAPCP